MNPQQIEEILAENEKLKNILGEQDERKKRRRNLGWNFLKRSSGYVLGSELKRSIERFLEEMAEQQRVSRETLSDLLTSIIIRLTRVGFLLVITAILPSILLIFQTYYLAKQNTLITGQSEMFRQQNNRLDQQTYLQEADRRGQTLLLMDNMLQEINTEISRDPQNKLNDATAGRLIALSKILKPYRYLENDSLTKNIVSPERGYLLISLLETGINLRSTARSRANGILLERIDFTYSELRNVTLKKADLIEIDLSHADMRNSSFNGTDFEKATFYNASISQADLSYTSLKNADLRNATLQNSILDYANLQKANLSSSNLKNVSLLKTVLKEATLTNAIVHKTFERDAKMQLNKDQSEWLFSNYEVTEIDTDSYQLLPIN
ncbi:pentapeptide repeat-containing protein [Leeuwenhoekiella sp. LLG6367-2.1]|uniref:pentapeptide repeat-containing protein n=1 Tax=Leeuwenhoekiella sp. LLG6367-2.1 TaxID=3160833 RepID=UPI00386A017C